MTKFREERLEEISEITHPPLLESIFELRWEIENHAQSGRMRDPSYPMMYGSLYERLRKDLPLLEDLPSSQAHPESTPYVPRHRMRREKDAYPLMQVGPGILTINMAKEYSWESFSSLIMRVISSVIELYPSGSIPLNLIKAELRYVNGVRFDIARDHPLQFLEDKLHIKMDVDGEFFKANALNDRPNALGLNLSYVLDKPVGNLSISTHLGQFDAKPAFIQQILVQSFSELVPSEMESFSLWLEEAHSAIKHAFFALCRGPLMEKFCAK